MLRRLILLFTLSFAAQLGFAAEAGKVIFVAGKAQAGDRQLALNAPVNEGELLSTGADGYLYIKTPDDGLFILRPNSKARIAAYHIDEANPANTRIKLELLSGVARSQSGQAVKRARQNFRFNTPVAAIGVRGTDFTVFTNDSTSRVAVLSGGITISGFGGACSPEGTGPCEGHAARDLSASQKGMLLQIQKGQSAAQQVQGGALSPDTIAPPRPDEPVAVAAPAASSTGAPVAPALDPLKAVVFQQQPGNGNNAPVEGGSNNPPVITPPPVVEETPVTPGPIAPGPVNPTPVEPTPPTNPVPTVPVPVVPEKKIEWGRFAAIASSPVDIDVVANRAAGSELIAMKGYYALMRSPGKEYVQPERGSIGFSMKGGEAFIFSDNVTVQPVKANLENGALTLNFDTKRFVTNFDVVNGSERIYMSANGPVEKNGVFGTMSGYTPNTNMSVTGVHSQADGGSAAYIFQRTLEDNRSINGITLWGSK